MNSKIVVKIFGGLGNQMFQYACGYALARRYNAQLCLDISAYKVKTHQGFEIPRFEGFSEEVLSEDEVLGLFGRFFPLKLLLIRKLLPNGRSVFVEKKFGMYNELPMSGNLMYLMGYWQSASFFNECAEELREKFVFKLQNLEKNQPILEKMKRNNSIAIHVRRGDYVSIKSNQQYHGVCSLEYYNNAIGLMEEKLDSPCFFIFSDDTEWANANLDFKGAQVYLVDVNKGSDSFMDMYMISQCNHQIIANSSFSWWGAWLNNHPEKIIVAPEKWFADTSIVSKNIIPEGWIRL
ncbi:MAG TPA: alpha-1,2-fucosyltransferase [Chitinophaga sp.]|uniref:alpha-1,2-fucosyltransferase n=1 Tax=Chitinophaga sp. TaxID=1869181 RepID=UPI002C1E58D1|nr:alpha-1,2-fucosyltransferase [Chitinophaga sp.]HVI45456.1 alpha-1,2-fucosyltransferase [Chitinophaga sp.]